MKKFIILMTLLITSACHSQKLTPSDYYQWGIRNDNYSENYTDVPFKKDIPTVVIFWSSTCKPAVNAIDSVKEKIENWKKSMNFQVMIVCGSGYENKSTNEIILKKSKDMAKRREWTNQIIDVYDHNSLIQQNNIIDAYPTYQVFDKKSKLIYQNKGYNRETDHPIDEIYNALKDCQ